MSTPALRLVERSAACFSSKRGDWETPSVLFQELDREFHFALDAAATRGNAKCSRFLTVEEDALSRSWAPGPAWLNPPYGRGIGAWVRKALEESRRGALVVCLIPARTDTAWFQDYVLPFAEVRFLRGRLRFVGAEHSAPFPSAIAIFRPEGASHVENAAGSGKAQERASEAFLSVPADSGECQRCGAGLPERERRHGDPRRFCSPRCRKLSWKEGRE